MGSLPTALNKSEVKKTGRKGFRSGAGCARSLASQLARTPERFAKPNRICVMAIFVFDFELEAAI